MRKQRCRDCEYWWQKEDDCCYGVCFVDMKRLEDIHYLADVCPNFQKRLGLMARHAPFLDKSKSAGVPGYSLVNDVIESTSSNVKRLFSQNKAEQSK